VPTEQARTPAGVLRFADFGETLTALKDNEAANRFIVWQDSTQSGYHFEVADEAQRDYWVVLINARLVNYITARRRESTASAMPHQQAPFS